MRLSHICTWAGVRFVNVIAHGDEVTKHLVSAYYNLTVLKKKERDM